MISTENFSPQTISTVRMNNRHRACLKTVENFHQIYAYAKLDGHPYIRGVNRKLHRKWNGFGHIEFIFVPPNVGTIKCENWQKICPDSYKYMHANEHMQNHTHTHTHARANTRYYCGIGFDYMHSMRKILFPSTIVHAHTSVCSHNSVSHTYKRARSRSHTHIAHVSMRMHVSVCFMVCIIFISSNVCFSL